MSWAGMGGEEGLIVEEASGTTVAHCKGPFWPGRSSCKAEV